MGKSDKSTISMAIFNSHVSLPEGKVCFDADSHHVEMVKYFECL